MELADLVIDDRERGVFRVHRSSMTSPAVHALERERIFNRCWLYAGHESEVEQPGDYIRRRVAGRPVFLVRGQDGEVRVFLNTCPHRGALVCRQDAGNAEVFQCFYHAWSFNDRGDLVGLPDEEGYAEGFDRSERGLLAPPRVSNYRGFYFVSFSPDGEDLATYLGEATEYFDLLISQSDTGLGLAVVPGALRCGIATNWKLFVENSFDLYHAPSVHQTLFSYLKRLGHDSAAITARPYGQVRPLGNGHAVLEMPTVGGGRPVAKWHPMYGEAAKSEIEGIRARLQDRLGEETMERIAGSSRLLIIYPNLVLHDSAAPGIWTIWPDRPDFMELTIQVVCAKEDVGARLERRLSHFELGVSATGYLHPDDVEALESCQAGFDAPEMEWSDVSRGMHREAHGRDELQMRTFWRQWHAQVQGYAAAASWSDRPTPVETTARATAD
jgi:p-cumate 2,3-dioxygenase alpha subunit